VDCGSPQPRRQGERRILTTNLTNPTNKGEGEIFTRSASFAARSANSFVRAVREVRGSIFFFLPPAEVDHPIATRRHRRIARLEPERYRATAPSR